MTRAGRRLMRRVSARGSCGDSGNAIVEFLGIALVLLIPLVYLVLVLARLQAAGYAVQGAAKDAGRAYVLSASATEADSRAQAAVVLAVRDQGFSADDAHLAARCSISQCLNPGTDVTTTVTILVTFPGIPSVARSYIPVQIPVSSTHVTTVDRLRAEQ